MVKPEKDLSSQTVIFALLKLSPANFTKSSIETVYKKWEIYSKLRRPCRRSVLFILNLEYISELL